MRPRGVRFLQRAQSCEIDREAYFDKAFRKVKHKKGIRCETLEKDHIVVIMAKWKLA